MKKRRRPTPNEGLRAERLKLVIQLLALLTAAVKLAEAWAGP